MEAHPDVVEVAVVGCTHDIAAGATHRGAADDAQPAEGTIPVKSSFIPMAMCW
jgi:hypothetical protein